MNRSASVLSLSLSLNEIDKMLKKFKIEKFFKSNHLKSWMKHNQNYVCVNFEKKNPPTNLNSSINPLRHENASCNVHKFHYANTSLIKWEKWRWRIILDESLDAEFWVTREEGVIWKHSHAVHNSKMRKSLWKNVKNHRKMHSMHRHIHTQMIKRL